VVETEPFKATSAGPLLADIFRCPGQSQGSITFLHGGALLLGSRTDLPREIISFLHAERWDVASVDYRLAPAATLVDIRGDVVDGLAFARARLPRGPMIAVGYSAGAYLALLSGAYGGCADGIIAFAGYGDLEGAWYYEPSDFFLGYKQVEYVEGKLRRGEAFVSPEERIDLYVYLRQRGLWPEFILGQDLNRLARELSPIRHLSPRFPPTVLVHGDQDPDVPVSTSIEMAAALGAHGTPHRLTVMPRFDHDLFARIEDHSVALAWREALSFLTASQRHHVT